MRKSSLSRADFNETYSTAEECLRCANLLVRFSQFPLTVQRFGTRNKSNVDPDLSALLVVDGKPVAGTSRHEIYCKMADLFTGISASLIHFKSILGAVQEFHLIATQGPFKEFGEWHKTAHAFAFRFTWGVWKLFSRPLSWMAFESGRTVEFDWIPDDFTFPAELLSRERGAKFYVGEWMPAACELLQPAYLKDEERFRALLQIECSRGLVPPIMINFWHHSIRRNRAISMVLRRWGRSVVLE